MAKAKAAAAVVWRGQGRGDAAGGRGGGQDADAGGTSCAGPPAPPPQPSRFPHGRMALEGGRAIRDLARPWRPPPALWAPVAGDRLGPLSPVPTESTYGSSLGPAARHGHPNQP